MATMAVPRLCLERWQSTAPVFRGSVTVATVATVATVEKPFFRIKSDFFYFFHFSHCFSMIFFFILIYFLKSIKQLWQLWQRWQSLIIQYLQTATVTPPLP